MSDLTEAELTRLSQAVETDEGTGFIYAVAYAVKAIVAEREQAAARRALEDAADAVKRVRESDTYTPGYPEHPQFEKWLRDRAAGVGTKDGDDDE